MERRTLGRAAGLGVVAAVAVAGLWLLLRGSIFDSASQGPAPSGVERIVPRETRIRVEVLNATNVRGLARRASLYLRDLGFDVVRYAQDDTIGLDSTIVVDRTAHPDWVEMLSGAMSDSKIETQLDSSRYVDITVRLGTTWRPPPKAFYP